MGGTVGYWSVPEGHVPGLVPEKKRHADALVYQQVVGPGECRDQHSLAIVAFIVVAPNRLLVLEILSFRLFLSLFTFAGEKGFGDLRCSAADMMQ